MESFSGVFIASTNLMEGIDAAALRRFDMKIHFDYLGPDQAALMLERQCAALGLALAETDRARLQRLALLTPGDFAALARRHRFTPFVSSMQVVEALAQECALKRGKSSAIGFIT
jgi:SpoVK/Ycf46/Vps4 family AAA+-type ATPase